MCSASKGPHSHEENIFIIIFQAADGQPGAGVGTSGQMLISALTGDLASHASGKAMAGPNRRCSEGTDSLTPRLGRCFEKCPDELNS